MPAKQTEIPAYPTRRGVVIELAIHLSALAPFVALQPLPDGNLFRNGHVISLSQAREIQMSDGAVEGDPQERADEQEPRGYKYGEMSEEQAKALYGKRIVVRLRIVEEITGRDRRTAYRCKGNEVADRFIQFGDSKPIDGSLTDGRELMVEATLLMETALKMGDKIGYRAQFLLTEARLVGR